MTRPSWRYSGKGQRRHDSKRRQSDFELDFEAKVWYFSKEHELLEQRVESVEGVDSLLYVKDVVADAAARTLAEKYNISVPENGRSTEVLKNARNFTQQQFPDDSYFIAFVKPSRLPR